MAGQLSSPELDYELCLFLRLTYKNKSQHRGSPHFQRLWGVRRLALKLQRLELPQVVRQIAAMLVPPQGMPPDGGRVRPGHRQVMTMPSRQAVAFALCRLLSAAGLVQDICEVGAEARHVWRQGWRSRRRSSLPMQAIEGAVAHVSVLLAQSYFMPLASAALAALSRLFFLYCRLAVAVADGEPTAAGCPSFEALDGSEKHHPCLASAVYNGLAKVAPRAPASLSAAASAALDPELLRLLPASLLLSWQQGTPLLQRDGRLALFDSALVAALTVDPDETRALAAAAVASGPAPLEQVLPGGLVPSQLRRKGLRAASRARSRPVVAATAAVMVVEDRGPAAAAAAAALDDGVDLGELVAREPEGAEMAPGPGPSSIAAAAEGHAVAGKRSRAEEPPAPASKLAAVAVSASSYSRRAECPASSEWRLLQVPAVERPSRGGSKGTAPAPAPKTSVADIFDMLLS